MMVYAAGDDLCTFCHETGLKVVHLQEVNSDIH